MPGMVLHICVLVKCSRPASIAVVLAADGGRYFDDMREASPNPLCADADLARALWEKSAALTGARYEF